MAPEQIVPPPGKTRCVVSTPADIYAVGAVLYFCLTGTAPFGKNRIANLVAGILEQFPKPSMFRSDIPLDLEMAIQRATETNPYKRHPDAGAFSALL